MNEWMSERASERAQPIDKEVEEEEKNTPEQHNESCMWECKYCNAYYSNTISHTHSREIDGIQIKKELK